MNLTDADKKFLGALDVRLFDVGGTTVTLATVIAALMVAVATLWISRLLRRALGRVLRKRQGIDEGTIGVMTRLTHYAVLALGAGIALHTIGFDLTALFAAGALFAVAIGFAMQNVVSNFVSGLILLVERAIKPGDVIDFEGQLVSVKDMGIRTTLVRTLDDEDLIIPNSLLVQAAVRNFTFRDDLYRLRVEVGVSYDSDMRRVRETLEQTMGALEWRSRQRDPAVLLSAFGTSSVDWEASVWIEDPWRSRTGRSRMREAIWWALKDAGVTIAYPQLDLHVDPPVEESLRAIGGAAR